MSEKIYVRAPYTAEEVLVNPDQTAVQAQQAAETTIAAPDYTGLAVGIGAAALLAGKLAIKLGAGPYAGYIDLIASVFKKSKPEPNTDLLIQDLELDKKRLERQLAEVDEENRDLREKNRRLKAALEFRSDDATATTQVGG